MSYQDLILTIDALHPKNAVRIVEAVRDNALLGLSDEAADGAEKDIEAFAAVLDLPTEWREQVVTSQPRVPTRRPWTPEGRMRSFF